MTPEDPDRHDRSADAVHEGRPVDAELVRAGRPGVPVLLVLVVSTAAAALALFGLWALFHGAFSSEASDVGGGAAAVRSFEGDAQGRPPTADAPTSATGEARPVATGEAPNVNAPTVPSSTANPADARSEAGSPR